MKFRLIEDKIADKIRANQDTQGMTKRAIQTLKARGGKYDDLAQEYKRAYGEDALKESTSQSYIPLDLYRKISKLVSNAVGVGMTIDYILGGNDYITHKEKINAVIDTLERYSDAFMGVADDLRVFLDKMYDESLQEDTVKTKSGKWTNRGDTGETHGEFRTKKEADAQRKAIWASGWKGRK